MALRHPYPNVYKFYNHFPTPDQSSYEQSSRSQGLRKSGPRSKTGCSTCKLRRVKCDEGKPGCVRCQNLGRECGGYAPEAPEEPVKQIQPIPIHPRPMTMISQNPSMAIPGDEHERRYFQRYCDKTASEICGTWDADFWMVKIPQLSQQYAPIRLATVALGALARSLEITSSPTRLSLSGFPQFDHHHLDDHHKFAIRQYGRAIASLRAVLSDGRRHLRTSLTSCVLFLTFESLQGCYEGALTHLRGGSRLLADWRTARRGNSSRLSQDSLSEIQDSLVDDLGRMFARLDVQGLFVPPPYPVPDLLCPNLIVPEAFSSTQEARETWDFLMAGIGQFYRKSVVHSQLRPEELSTPSWLEQHEHYSTQLKSWRSAFQVVYGREIRSGAIRPEDSNMLSLYYNIATILLASSVEHTEMVYDEYNHLFSEIISKSQQMLASPDHPAHTSRFTLDLGTLLPLTFTAIKCRDRRIRRQAIGLLWSKPHREGLCLDTITVARISAWLSSIEGEGTHENLESIPEASRWMITYLHLNSEERWIAIQLTRTKENENGTYAYRETTFSW